MQWKVLARNFISGPDDFGSCPEDDIIYEALLSSGEIVKVYFKTIGGGFRTVWPHDWKGLAMGSKQFSYSIRDITHYREL